MPNLSRLAVAALCAMAAASAAYAQKVQSVPAPAAPSAARAGGPGRPQPGRPAVHLPRRRHVRQRRRRVAQPDRAKRHASIPRQRQPRDRRPGPGQHACRATGPTRTTATTPPSWAPAPPCAAPARRLGGAGGFSATDTARSFFFADANKDGELTRAEAARLSISTMSFEEMDRNFDGVITRFEYSDSVR